METSTHESHESKLFVVLRNQHAHVKELFRCIDPTTMKDVQEREKLFQELKVALLSHSDAVRI